MNGVLTEKMADALGELWGAVGAWAEVKGGHDLTLEEERVMRALESVDRASRSEGA